ncbi:MAG TPA: hypothetical protein PK788_01465 [Gemmatimonadaceae bacterium]|nr:hypothetical protein [Gemmatimonadaceae bacterium]HRQ76999.1 hypothetical protein [Gemmatimonadaceae bacterium]
MTDALRSYSFIADTDSLGALQRLRHGWAAWELAEGEFRVRLRDGGTVRVHVDRAEIEPGFEVSCVVADFIDDSESLPLRDSAFTSDGNDVVVFRGITWFERRPDLGPDHTIQFSGIPGIELPDGAVAKCDFTDAIAIVSEGGAVVVRLALRPGWLEVVDSPEEVAKFFALRGYA